MMNHYLRRVDTVGRIRDPDYSGQTIPMEFLGMPGPVKRTDVAPRSAADEVT